MHNREGLSLKRLWQAALDYDLYPIYILGLMFGLPTTPPMTYLTLSLKNIGYAIYQSISGVCPCSPVIPLLPPCAYLDDVC